MNQGVMIGENKMKVKCKVCGLKGFYNDSKITEFSAPRFLLVSKFKGDMPNGYFICRNCIRDVLDSLKFEQYRIDNLYKPEIKEKK